MTNVLKLPIDCRRLIECESLWVGFDSNEKERLIVEAAKAEINTALALLAAGQVGLDETRELILDYASLVTADRAPPGRR